MARSTADVVVRKMFKKSLEDGTMWFCPEDSLITSASDCAKPVNGRGCKYYISGKQYCALRLNIKKEVEDEQGRNI